MAAGETADPTRKLWWTVPAATVLVLLMLTMFVQQQKDPLGKGTSFDASPGGFRAAYLLLDDLGYPVVRSRRLSGDPVRWLLYPKKADRELPNLDGWLRSGGVLLLADDHPEWAAQHGITLQVQRGDDQDVKPATGPDLGRIVSGSVSVDWPGQTGEVWARAGDEPLVTVYRRGRGAVYLVNRPEALTNRCLLEADRSGADNGVLVCRLAEATLAGQPGRLAFDEYFHGLRDRPGVIELLLEPPLLWVTLQGLLLLGLVLWRAVPRFGVVHEIPPARRRSQEEFLDALAGLLQRKADHADAVAAVRTAWRRELEQELGLPLDVPAETLAREAARLRPIDPKHYRRLLEGADAGRGSTAFVHALNDLEKARHEFFQRRDHR